MKEPLPFSSTYTRKGWSFPVDALTPPARALIGTVARCPACGARVTLESTACKRGHTFVRQDRTFGSYATLNVPYEVSTAIHRYHVLRYRNWQRKFRRQETLADADGWHTRADIRALYDAQEGRCYYCGKRLGAFGTRAAFHVEHLISVASGGSQWPGNLSLACAYCNVRKGMRSERAMWGELGRIHGRAWLAKRRRAIIEVRKRRRKIDLARQLATRRYRVSPERG